jgi:hypothetical protein
MTSQQILALCRQAAEMGVKLNEGFSIREPEQLGMGIVFLGEIAYQLAVLNERETESSELTPPEIVEAAGKFYRACPEGFGDRVFLELTARQQRWWLMEARKTANAQPTAQEPTPEANK